MLLWHKNDDLLRIAVDDWTHQLVVESVTSLVTDNAHVVPTRPTICAPTVPGLEDDGSTWNLTTLRHPLVRVGIDDIGTDRAICALDRAFTRPG